MWKREKNSDKFEIDSLTVYAEEHPKKLLMQLFSNNQNVTITQPQGLGKLCRHNFERNRALRASNIMPA